MRLQKTFVPFLVFVCFFFLHSGAPPFCRCDFITHVSSGKSQYTSMLDSMSLSETGEIVSQLEGSCDSGMLFFLLLEILEFWGRAWLNFWAQLQLPNVNPAKLLQKTDLVWPAHLLKNSCFPWPRFCLGSETASQSCYQAPIESKFQVKETHLLGDRLNTWLLNII